MLTTDLPFGQNKILNIFNFKRKHIARRYQFTERKYKHSCLTFSISILQINKIAIKIIFHQKQTKT
jgi:hypothetical protein